MRYKTLRYNTQTYLQIATLLEKGYSLQQIFTLLNREKDLVILLERYRSVQEALLACAKGKFAKHLCFFTNVYSIHEAIFSAYKMVDFEAQIKKELIKKTMYPIFIFLLSFTTIYLFSHFVIPQLITQIEQSDNTILFLILDSVKICSSLVVMGVILVIFMLLVITTIPYGKKQFYNQYAYRCKFIRNYISYYLSGYLKTLHERGLSTLQSFQFLLNMHDCYLKSTVQLMNEQICNGVEMQQVIQECHYLGDTFQTYYMIGTHNGELDMALSNYMEQQQNEWFALIKKISIAVQCTAYVFVGILIICVYQIMLVPLQMIQEL